MVTFNIDQGTISVPDALVAAVKRHAERAAEYTAAFLEVTGLLRSVPTGFTAAMLLELGALVQLWVWERQGLRPFMDVNLPTFAEAAQNLAEHLQQGPEEFEKPEVCPLSRRVLEVFIEHLAWEAPLLLQADVVVGGLTDEDAFADALAEFLWQHRRGESTFAHLKSS